MRLPKLKKIPQLDLNLVIPIAISLLSIVGWIFEVRELTGPKTSARIKFSTSLMLLFTTISIGTFSLRDTGKNVLSKFMATVSLTILATIIFWDLLDESFIFTYFYAARDSMIDTVKKGYPSHLAMILLILLNYGVIVNRIQKPFYPLVVICIAAFAILGHLQNIKIAYAYIPEISNGMTIPATLGFLFLGEYLLLNSKRLHR